MASSIQKLWSFLSHNHCSCTSSFCRRHRRTRRWPCERFSARAKLHWGFYGSGEINLCVTDDMTLPLLCNFHILLDSLCQVEPWGTQHSEAHSALWRRVVWDKFTDTGMKHLWNVGKQIPVYMGLQPRRQPSSYSPPQKLQFLLRKITFVFDEKEFWKLTVDFIFHFPSLSTAISVCLHIFHPLSLLYGHLRHASSSIFTPMVNSCLWIFYTWQRAEVRLCKAKRCEMVWKSLTPSLTDRIPEGYNS
jgi:hypothetical protein